jgi:AraC family transcriptional regulator, regulatory protein of adaptative response / methylated-DNA-[protein]-cysteine methyltransferase
MAMSPVTPHTRVMPKQENNLAQDELFWQAVKTRDRSFDGKFYFAVATTGVYCRPSCACRLPLRKNVRFYGSREDAERAGFRACLRCRPAEPVGTDPALVRIQEVCDYIRAHAQDSLSLSMLAEGAGLSRFHFLRSFKKVVGLTPKQFIDANRLQSFRKELRKNSSVTNAIYEAGFGSSSRVYERVDTRLGMTPAEYRSAGKEVTLSYVCVDSVLGRMMIGATDRGLCFIQFAASDKELLEMLRAEYSAARCEPMHEPFPPEFENWMTALREHLDGQQPRLDLPVDVRATAFQMKVWQYLQFIPYGSVQSYAEVAAGLGQPRAARAVARACAQNRVALAIPCHRVIRGTGELGGYRWGLERKRVLIDLERRSMNQQ